MLDTIKSRLFGDPKRKYAAGLMLFAGSVIGLLASFVLSIEALILAENAHAVLNCDLNATFSCSIVAQHWSAELLGFPNSFIGMVTLPVMVTISVALLAGAKFPRWFMQAAQMGALGGFFFALWMFYMSFVEIGALCPWCLMLDIGMLMIFYGLTRHNVLSGNINYKWLRQFVDKQFDAVVMISIVVLVVVMIIGKFGL